LFRSAYCHRGSIFFTPKLGGLRGIIFLGMCRVLYNLVSSLSTFFCNPAKQEHNPQPTTHNPQPTTHNPQHQDEPPPPYPTAALPSLSMGRAVAPPNLGAATPHGSTASARWRVCDRRCWFSCLGHRNMTHQKLERGTGSRP
jgi:hypothetical protein